MKRLAVPAPVISDADSQEMLCAFIAERQLHCSFHMGQWTENAAASWGVLLADVAQHITVALRQTQGVDQTEALQRLVAAFNTELMKPTADHSGDFVEDDD